MVTAGVVVVGAHRGSTSRNPSQDTQVAEVPIE
jgi:hypothetical protein